MNRRDINRMLLAVTVLPARSDLRAQTAWPNKPVRWILSQPAGAGPDIIARYLGEQLSKLWGESVVIENRPGGQNVIGAQAAARSMPDGYTFFYGTTAAMITNVFTFKSLPYDPAKDFAPIRLIGRSAFFLAAGPAFSGTTLADAISQASAQPGALAVATEGPKTFSGILADSVAAMARVKFNHVAYTKASEAIQDVVGGRVGLVCLPEAALLGSLRSGQLRGLAVSTSQRSANFPAVATLSETFAGFEYSGWNALFAPAGTPPSILTRVNRDLEGLLGQPEVAQRLQQLGSSAEPNLSVAAFEAFMNAERDRWAQIVKNIGLTPE